MLYSTKNYKVINQVLESELILNNLKVFERNIVVFIGVFIELINYMIMCITIYKAVIYRIKTTRSNLVQIK